MPIRRMLSAALLASLLAAAGPVEAQSRGQTVEALASVLGGMHYLRSLCTAETQLWRDYMLELLRLEAGAPQARARLTAAFNDAYHARAKRYPACTTDARAEATRLAAEGERLAAALKFSR